MISHAGRIVAENIDEAVKQIPPEIKSGYKIWFVGYIGNLSWFEWRGWK